jgi:hypothetical protein
MVIEVTPKGKLVYSYNTNGSVYCGEKTRQGTIVYVNSGGQLVEMDVKGKQIRTINVGGTGGWGGVEKLANGNYLVGQYSSNQVVEVDKTGKVVWKCAVNSPALATRLRNGHTLVSSIGGCFFAEYDKQGKEVWRHKTVGRPFRVRRY